MNVISKEIPVPDILPNNMKKIRLMNKKNIADISNALCFKKSYISLMENSKANLSGKAAMLVMEYYNVSFYQLFDIEDKVVLPYTTNTYETINLEIEIGNQYIDLSNSRNIAIFDDAITQKLNFLEIDGLVSNFDILKTIELKGTETSIVFLSVTLLKKTTVDKEFDINFFKEMNLELFNTLAQKGFAEIEDVRLKENDFIVSGDIVTLNKQYNIVKDIHSKDYVTTNCLSINANDFKIIKSYNNEIKEIEIRVVTESFSNIKFIENFLNIKSSDTKTALDFNTSQYNALLKGEQKLSTKTMWRLVKFFKVPLELIVNIPKYRSVLLEL